jgi:DNA-binding MarR family transcriptional regulator
VYHRHNKRFTNDLEGLKRDVPGPSGNAASPEQHRMLCEHARQIRYQRGVRAELFDRSIFGEPAWDMLLALYTIDGDRRRLNTGDLAELASVALTTALRWLDYLEEQSLIERRSNPFDQRMVYVELADKGRAKMDSYLLRIHSANMLPSVQGLVITDV